MKNRLKQSWSTLHIYEFSDGETGHNSVKGKNKPDQETSVWVW